MVWKKGKRVISAGKTITAVDRRFRIVGGHDLQISRVKVKDTGTFTCSVSTESVLEITHQVDVLCEFRFFYFVVVDGSRSFAGFKSDMPLMFTFVAWLLSIKQKYSYLIGLSFFTDTWHFNLYYEILFYGSDSRAFLYTNLWMKFKHVGVTVCH